MDVLYGSMNNSQYVVDYEYNGGINQQWQLVPTKIEQVMPDGYYEIRSAVSGKNLEVYGVSTQGRTKLLSGMLQGQQSKWKLENQSDGTIRLTNVNSGLVLDYNASTNSYEQWDWHGGSNQDGKYQVANPEITISEICPTTTQWMCCMVIQVTASMLWTMGITEESTSNGSWYLPIEQIIQTAIMKYVQR